jgi:hypothetical protein
VLETAYVENVMEACTVKPGNSRNKQDERARRHYKGRYCFWLEMGK